MLPWTTFPQHPPPMSRLLNILLAVVLLATPLAAQEGRSLHWREIHVTAHIDEDGRLRIRERQAMVFDGAWNGGERRFNVRTGQQLELHGLTRIDPVTGATTVLTRAEPDQVDEYDWAEEHLLRWRSRADSDPPFRDAEIVYELDYSIWPVLVPMGEGEYELRHDFAFTDRHGVIERFQVDLTLDDAWTSPFGNHIQETATQLEPGRGYVLTVPLRHADGEPALAGSEGASALVRGAVAVGALAVPLVVLLGLRRRTRELDFLAPIVPHEAIDAEWLEREIFSRPAEVVGTAWDRAVGGAEVSALLARLVGEGKLSSRVAEEDGEPVLHLRRLAPLVSFPEHERELLEGLFFDGREETDTQSIAEHYKTKGFDPAGILRKPLLKKLEELPGEAGLRRPWRRWMLLVIAGAVIALLVPDAPGHLPVAVMGSMLGVIAMLIIPAIADALGKRVTHRRGLTVTTVIAVTIPALLLLATLPRYSVESAFGFYRPGAGLLIGFLTMLVGIGGFALAMATSTESVPRLVYRRRLVSGREYFKRELESPEPKLQDAWFPFLLAFGLDEDVSRWFEVHRQTDRTSGMTAATIAAAGQGSAGSSGGGWTGGGPQFGGGTFAGGGAGGAWGVAAAGLAAGVAAPGSTGGGGGGVAVSGGGGGGGW